MRNAGFASYDFRKRKFGFASLESRFRGIFGWLLLLLFFLVMTNADRNYPVSFLMQKLLRAEMFNAAIASWELRVSMRDSRVWKMDFFDSWIFSNCEFELSILDCFDLRILDLGCF